MTQSQKNGEKENIINLLLIMIVEMREYWRNWKQLQKLQIIQRNQSHQSCLKNLHFQKVKPNYLANDKSSLLSAVIVDCCSCDIMP